MYTGVRNKSQKRRPIGISRCKEEDNIKMDIKGDRTGR
jgi:hypothetical protein